MHQLRKRAWVCALLALLVSSLIGVSSVNIGFDKVKDKITESMGIASNMLGLSHGDVEECGYLTTNHGIQVEDADNSLKAGVRGPTLMEDFHFRERITAFDHERIPERVVHARGSGAHGYFQVYHSLANITRAAFLSDPSARTPVFVRFSTVLGSRGSADTVRDVRGFATKFYTSEGNFDLVGNNMPVFFIQDGIKFPDIIHAGKPHPHHEIPQAQTAHDNFWDFIGLVPETTHMVMWVLSDRALPRSYATMEGFGVHTFRLTNARNESRFVKFHWKPVLGVHSLTWDEYQKIGGMDPDYHRRDLWERIDAGVNVEFELGLQVIEDSDVERLGFDLLDATKIVPEEVVPVIRVGKMVLNRNPGNFFAETEQVAFHLGNMVPGIEPTEDPLLQARLFSYTDTQLNRFGSFNFHQLPINRPVVAINNYQQDGFMRYEQFNSRANYLPNSVGGGCPFISSMTEGAYTHHPVPMSGVKTRLRSPSFADHYTQATMFFESLDQIEQRHLIQAACFELGKVMSIPIRQRVVNQLFAVSEFLGSSVANCTGTMPMPNPAAAERVASVMRSPALSFIRRPAPDIRGLRIALIVSEGYDSAFLLEAQAALKLAGANAKIVAGTLQPVHSAHKGTSVIPDFTFVTQQSVLFDSAIIVPSKGVFSLLEDRRAMNFLNEMIRHLKVLGLPGGNTGQLDELCTRLGIRPSAEDGFLVIKSHHLNHLAEYAGLLAKYKVWERENAYDRA